MTPSGCPGVRQGNPDRGAGAKPPQVYGRDGGYSLSPTHTAEGEEAHLVDPSRTPKFALDTRLDRGRSSLERANEKGALPRPLVIYNQ